MAQMPPQHSEFVAPKSRRRRLVQETTAFSEGFAGRECRPTGEGVSTNARPKLVRDSEAAQMIGNLLQSSTPGALH